MRGSIMTCIKAPPGKLNPAPPPTARIQNALSRCRQPQDLYFKGEDESVFLGSLLSS